MRHAKAPSLRLLVGLLAAVLSASLAIPAPIAAAADGDCLTPPTATAWGPVAARSNKVRVNVTYTETQVEFCNVTASHMTITNVGGSTPPYDVAMSCQIFGDPLRSYNCSGDFWLVESSYLVETDITVCGRWCSTASHDWTLTVGPVCGDWGRLSPERFVPGGTTDNDRPTIEAWFRDDSRHVCGPGAWEMMVDGVTVPATATTVGDRYVLTYTPPASLSAGSHTVYAYVEEVCCNAQSEQNTDKASHTWSFIVDFCGRAPLVLSSFAPAGMTGETRPLIQATFTDNDYPCDLSSVVFLVDKVPVTPSVTRSGGTHVLSYVPAVPLAPGPHSVEVAIVEKGRYKAAGSAAWSFNTLAGTGGSARYEDDFPGVVITYTADKLTVERECGPLGTCVGPYTVPAPAQASLTFNLAATHAELSAGYTMAKYGPFNVEVPTPFGPFPVTLCAGAGDCVFPTATTKGTTVQGSVTLTLDVNGERTQQTIPLNYAS